VAIAYNLFSLRCLSVIRNCVQIRTLCTRQQFLYHFSLLSVFKVRVVARDSQAGMSNLILHEVAGHHTRLHVTDSTMPEGVHPRVPFPVFRRLALKPFCKCHGSQAMFQPVTGRAFLSYGLRGSNEAVEW